MSKDRRPIAPPPRPPVSIVILAWNAWEETRACLESLASTLSPRDEVIVVDNGSEDETPQRLLAYPWLRVITNELNRGFAAGCNQGAQAASNEIVIFLNNDTVLAGHWIDALVAPLAEPTVAASGPRSNFVSGPQQVLGATYPPNERRAMREFARSWSAAHRDEVSDVPRLVGFCLAIRKSAFEEVGRFDEGYGIGGFEDDDLCRSLVEAGWRLVIAHGCFVHHAGHRTFSANEVDWFALQCENQARYEAKFERRAALAASSGAPAAAKVAASDRRELDEQEAELIARSIERAGRLSVAGSPGEAAAELLSELGEGRVDRAMLEALVVEMGAAGLPLERLAAAVPDGAVRRFFIAVLELSKERATEVLEACFEHRVDQRLAVLAAASAHARLLPIEGALSWSARLRAHGLRSACPLIAIAADSSRDPVERARACAVGYAVFGDEHLAAAFPVAFALAGEAQRAAITAETSLLAPQLLSGERELSPSGPPVRTSGRGSMRVSIIIPCWNKADFTLACLRAIEAYTPKDTYEVVIVDNGSSDATARLRSQPDAGFIVVRNSENLGFAKACNQGAAAATSDLLVFLNNDTEVLPGWLPPIFANLAGNPLAGVVGARLLFPDGLIQHAGVSVSYAYDRVFGGFHSLYRRPGAFPPALVRRRLRVVTGAVMAVRREVFEAVGGFDERYWNGNEDVELCLRAGELGWQVVYEPASCIVHHESVSGPERFTRVDTNRALLHERWGHKVAPETELFQAVGGSFGVNVVGDFSASGPEGPSWARAVVKELERMGLAVVTTALQRPDLAPAGSPYRHRLGPVQPSTLLCLPALYPAIPIDGLAEWSPSLHRIVLLDRPLDELEAWQRRVVSGADQSLSVGVRLDKVVRQAALAFTRRANGEPGRESLRQPELAG